MFWEIILELDFLIVLLAGLICCDFFMYEWVLPTQAYNFVEEMTEIQLWLWNLAIAVGSDKLTSMLLEPPPEPNSKQPVELISLLQYKPTISYSYATLATKNTPPSYKLETFIQHNFHSTEETPSLSQVSTSYNTSMKTPLANKKLANRSPQHVSLSSTQPSIHCQHSAQSSKQISQTHLAILS